VSQALEYSRLKDDYASPLMIFTVLADSAWVLLSVLL
jgi:hypothetical protein